MQFEKKDAIGFINFDSGIGSNNEVEIRIPFEKLKGLTRGKYIIIPHDSDGHYYLARLTKGPFYTPDAVSRILLLLEHLLYKQVILHLYPIIMVFVFVS